MLADVLELIALASRFYSGTRTLLCLWLWARCIGGRAVRLERVGISGCAALLGGLEGVARVFWKRMWEICTHGDALW